MRWDVLDGSVDVMLSISFLNQGFSSKKNGFGQWLFGSPLVERFNARDVLEILLGGVWLRRRMLLLGLLS
jgi:hypothetical protein